MISRPFTIEIALLGYVRPNPQHGYEIHRRYRAADGLGRIWNLKQAQLYAVLGKLEEAGYLTASIPAQETRPARRMFHLTPNGEQAFQNWMTGPVRQPQQLRQEFQAKLYFAQREGAEVCTRLLDEQRQACRRWLAANTAAAEKDAAGSVHLWLLDQFRIGQIRAMLDWLDVCQEKLA